MSAAAPAPPAPRVLPEDDREEIRFALAMNGGVSLAAWMGGVVHEIDQLRRGEGIYGELLELTQSTARVDVIAGASAGGLNGALLASAIACNTDLAGMRELWLQKGSFGELLRDPLRADPPSLLRGDEYFLPSVRSAFEAIYLRRRNDPDPQPIELIITATTLTGEVRTFVDAFGTLIADADHRARFTFRRDPEGERDDFADQAAPSRLALAARTSASFPGAFEPSFVPVGKGTSGRPDMRSVASFSASRYAIDGGVLVNLPVGQMLRAILQLPARGQVRRVAAVIVPAPAEFDRTVPDNEKDLPTIVQVATASLSGLPRQQSIGEHLDQIETYNRRVLERRRRRDELLIALNAAELCDLAQHLGPTYLRARRADVAQFVLERLVAAAGAAETGTNVGFDREAIVAALNSFQNPPWLPSTAQLEAFLRGEGGAAVGVVWPWGRAPVERTAAVVLDILRHALLLMPIAREGDRAFLRDRREETYRALRALRILRGNEARVWEGLSDAALEAGSEPALLANWVRMATERWRQEVPIAILADLSYSLAGRLASAATRVRAVHAQGVRPLQSIVDALDALAPPQARADQTLRNLLALEIVERALVPDETQPAHAIELVQVSGNTGNAFDARARASDKLAGLQLEHFGAFYKSSWRANDWLWGRLDGIGQLLQVLLLPRRLRQLGYSSSDAVALVRSIALEQAAPSDRVRLQQEWDENAVANDLSYLDGHAPLPKNLNDCIRALVRRAQLECLREELPIVARAVLVDVDDGGFRVPARHWASRIQEHEELTADKAIEVFRANEIGRERIADEVGSDLFTRIGTKAFATATTALRGRHSGLVGPLKSGATFARGVTLATYLLARGAVGRHKTAAAFVTLVLALAAAIIAIPLATGTKSWGGLTTLAAIVLAGGFGLALIRSGWVIVVVLTVAVAGGAVAALTGLIGDDDKSPWHRLFGWIPDVAPAIPVAVVVALAILFGLVRKPHWARRSGSSRSWNRLDMPGIWGPHDQ